MLNPLMNINLDRAERDRMMKDVKVFVDSVNALEEQNKEERQGLKEIKIMNKVCDKIFKK